LGDQEPTPDIIRDTNEYFNAITSRKSMQIVVNTAHNIEFTEAGRDALLAALREAAEAFRTAGR
jgi:hypothetical protein